MPRSYVKLRETVFDLYVERDQLPTYFRPIALFSTWLILIGYILFAISFSTADTDLNANRNIVTALASALLILGYITVAALAFFGRSLLFLVDGVVYPTLSSSLIGLMLTVLTYSLHVRRPVPQIYVSIPLVASSITTVIACVVLAIVYRELSQIRQRDERRRWHTALGPSAGPGDTNSIYSQRRVTGGPEDEAQRIQLMRLLHNRNEHPSMENMRGTYKIDLPGDQVIESRGRSASVPISKRFNVSNILPWNNSNNGTFKDARERRREEIERAGLELSAPATYSTWMRSRSNSREPVVSGGQHSSPTAWGWPPATRYA